jgi:vacuolar protein sorting-associated protein 45
VYADFFALSPTSFSLNLPAAAALSTPIADRTRDGLFALLLSLKKKPAIRYQGSSKDAEHVAALLSQHLDQQEDTLDFGRGVLEDVPPLLLILDRADDPVTPLLNQWTYQAMVHELVGIRNNMVHPAPSPGHLTL